jgi:hypothetical protein
MNSPKPRLATTSDRARLPRLSRAELERLLVRAKRAFEAFGTSAGRSEAEPAEDGRDHEHGDGAKRFKNTRPASAAVTF